MKELATQLWGQVQEWLLIAWFWLLGVSDPTSIQAASDWNWYAAAPTTRVVLIVLAVLAVLAAGLNLLPRVGMPWRTRLSLTVLRLLGFALLVLMLLQLELRVTVSRDLRPNVAIVTDTSGSMGIQDVNDASREAAARAFGGELEDALGNEAHISRYALDWRLRDDVASSEDEEAGKARMTRLIDGLETLVRTERDLQAVILLSDGNDTMGNAGAAVAPLYASRGLPVHPVVFGSADLATQPTVKFTGGSDFVRLGDELRLEATINAPEAAGQVVRAELFEDDAKQPLATRDRVRIGEKPTVVAFVFKPDKPGRKIYRIVVDGIKSAGGTRRIVAEHQVDVIDQKIRVLYADIPRPERKIIGHWLARDPVVDFAGLLRLPAQGWSAQGEMRHVNKSGFPDQEPDLHEYDVIIFGDLSRRYFSQGDAEETRLQWLVEFVQRRGGGLITLGGRAVYAAGGYHGSALAGILPFSVESVRHPQIDNEFAVVPTALGRSHPIMQLEREFKANDTAWADLPLIEGCNRVGRVRPGASLLANCDTPKDGLVPAIVFQNTGKGKVLSLAIDTTWRWEMMREIGSETEGIPEGTDYFRRFWGNAVRYLAPDPRLEPERPQIRRRQSDVAVGQTVVLSTRLVDEYYRPLRHADLTVRVISPSENTLRIYPDDSRSEPGVYQYEVTLNEPGTWRVEAIHKEADVLAAIAAAEAELAKAVKDDDPVRIAEAKSKVQAAKSRIAVENITAGDSLTEMEDPRAKPHVMGEFARATGGRVFTPEQRDELIDTLRLASHVFDQSYAVALWNLPATMILFILFVCLDCYIRKRRGMV